MLIAFVLLVSISVVCTVWPYASASAIFIDCRMMCGSRRVSAFELLLCIRLGCIFWGVILLLCVYVGVCQFFGCSWCVGCKLGIVCVSSLGVLVLMRLVDCPYVCLHCRWPALGLL